MSLASGSSGNCYYLATDHTAILIDAGIGIRTLKKVFKERMLHLEAYRPYSSPTTMPTTSRQSATWENGTASPSMLPTRYTKACAAVTA